MTWIRWEPALWMDDMLFISHDQGASLPWAHTPAWKSFWEHQKIILVFFFILPGRNEHESCQCASEHLLFFKKNSGQGQLKSLGNRVGISYKGRSDLPADPLRGWSATASTQLMYTVNRCCYCCYLSVEYLLCGSLLHAHSSFQFPWKLLFTDKETEALEDESLSKVSWLTSSQFGIQTRLSLSLNPNS